MQRSDRLFIYTQRNKGITVLKAKPQRSDRLFIHIQRNTGIIVLMAKHTEV